eukprot:364268-Chlamydomonas_euryale.AAC.13
MQPESPVTTASDTRSSQVEGSPSLCLRPSAARMPFGKPKLGQLSVTVTLGRHACFMRVSASNMVPPIQPAFTHKREPTCTSPPVTLPRLLKPSMRPCAPAPLPSPWPKSSPFTLPRLLKPRHGRACSRPRPHPRPNLLSSPCRGC